MMNEQQRRPQLADPQQQSPADGFGGELLSPDRNVGAMTTVSVGGTPMSAIPAMRVAVPRDLTRVLARIKALAARAGRDKYVYRWSVRNRRAGTSDEISGPTVKCALDVAREYGNCSVEPFVVDNGSHLIFYARFSDYETGFQITRAFQQRKNQDLGMSDKDRGADLIFQVGQSKAIRNVIINALSTYVDFAVEEAERGMLEWVAQNPEKAAETILALAKRNDVAVERIVQAFGRPLERFTERDLASALTRLKGIDDGLALAADEFPDVEKQERSAADPAAAKKPKAAEPAAAEKKPQPEKPQPEKVEKAPAPKYEAKDAEGPEPEQAKPEPPKAAPPKATGKPTAKSPLRFDD